MTTNNNFDKGLNIIVLLSIIETFKSSNGNKLCIDTVDVSDRHFLEL